MVFDAHTHIHFPAFDKDRDEVIKRARQQGVKMITVGTNIFTSQEAVLLAENHPNDIWATVGFHPGHVTDPAGGGAGWYFDKNELTEPVQEKFNASVLRNLAAHEKVVAIGECGLDYYRVRNPADVKTLTDRQELRIKELQKEVFREQIKIANELQKPLMIHCRPSKNSNDAYEDLVREFSIFNFQFPKVVHFFVGSLPTAKKLLAAGWLFTFGGVITFVRDYDEVIRYLPLENILLETDAPYVTPAPYRGQRNEPAYVVEVAKKVAQIKNLEFDFVIKKTTENVKRIFRI